MIDGLDPGLHLHHSERLGGELELPGDRDPALWSAPRTWVAGETLTASLMNTHLRDQMLWLGGTDQRLASPPATPIDGQLWRFVADSTAGVEWAFAYNAGDASASKWHKIGGPPLVSEVTTSESRTLATYGALTTAGPSVTLARGGDYDVALEFYPGAGGDVFMSYTIGASAAVDADAVRVNTGNQSRGHSGRHRRKAAIAAATTLTAQYKADGVTSSAFADRYMSADPVRVA